MRPVDEALIALHRTIKGRLDTHDSRLNALTVSVLFLGLGQILSAINVLIGLLK
jgi:hypothetical protein